MRRINTKMIATTSKMWIKPPMVYDVTKPRSHKIRRTTAIVYNIRKALTNNTFLNEPHQYERLTCSKHEELIQLACR